MAAVGQEKQWHSLNVDIEPSAREAIEYALMEAGALGTVTNDPSDGLIRIVGYFETTPDREQIRNELLEALRIYNLPTSSVRDMNVSTLQTAIGLLSGKRIGSQLSSENL